MMDIVRLRWLGACKVVLTSMTCRLLVPNSFHLVLVLVLLATWYHVRDLHVSFWPTRNEIHFDTECG